jgi:hypothetical protein
MAQTVRQRSADAAAATTASTRRTSAKRSVETAHRRRCSLTTIYRRLEAVLISANAPPPWTAPKSPSRRTDELLEHWRDRPPHPADERPIDNGRDDV